MSISIDGKIHESIYKVRYKWIEPFWIIFSFRDGLLLPAPLVNESFTLYNTISLIDKISNMTSIFSHDHMSDHLQTCYRKAVFHAKLNAQKNLGDVFTYHNIKAPADGPFLIRGKYN
ncbi:hypothetical protein DLJ74_05485 [Gracilibacillus dipsosauri]|uniref:Uncharacterized protein n=1 Tax=Gracilibacillus dipsosauri TaxID=178340 RepID=A0A317L3F8_9BACI|nr:hypothetical protein DLJ74_05485 [Gracilibacillus dipsosauri]